jgi:hypothetical protein
VVELARAASADPRKQFQRLAAVTLLPLIVSASCLGDGAIEALEVRTGRLLSSGHGGLCERQGRGSCSCLRLSSTPLPIGSSTESKSGLVRTRAW